jgi:hypothetical protein
MLVNGDQRTDQWELDITGVNRASQALEPATAGLLGMGLALLVGAGVWRRRQSSWLLATAVLFVLPFSSFAATTSVAADTYISATNPTLNIRYAQRAQCGRWKLSAD